MNSCEKILVLPAAGENMPILGGLFLSLKEIGYRPTTIACTSSGCIIGALICSTGVEKEFSDFLRNFLSKMYDLNKKNYISVSKFSSNSHGKNPNISIIDFEFNRQPRLLISAYNFEEDISDIFSTKFIKEFKRIETTQDLMSILRASINLPYILPEYKIDGISYFDNSISGPSILPEIKSLYQNSINVIYLCPLNICFPTKLFSSNIFLPGYRKNKILKDIDNLIKELDRFPGPLNENSGNTIYELKIALEKSSSSIASVIILYPTLVNSISYSDLEKGELSRKIRQSYEDGFNFRQYFKY